MVENKNMVENKTPKAPANNFSSFTVRVYSPFLCCPCCECQCDSPPDIVYSGFPTEEKAIEKGREIRHAEGAGLWIDVVRIGPRGGRKVIYTSSG